MVQKHQHNEHSSSDVAVILAHMLNMVGIIPVIIGAFIAFIFSAKLVAVIMGIELLNLISRYIYGYHTALYCATFFTLLAIGVFYSTITMQLLSISPLLQMW